MITKSLHTAIHPASVYIAKVGELWTICHSIVAEQERRQMLAERERRRNQSATPVARYGGSAARRRSATRIAQN